MKEILSEFNELLKRSSGVAIVKPDDKSPSMVIEPKETVEAFIQSLEAAINEDGDLSCEIRTAAAFESGYLIEMGVRIRQDDNDWSQNFELFYANKY